MDYIEKILKLLSKADVRKLKLIYRIILQIMED